MTPSKVTRHTSAYLELDISGDLTVEDLEEFCREARRLGVTRVTRARGTFGMLPSLVARFQVHPASETTRP